MKVSNLSRNVYVITFCSLLLGLVHDAMACSSFLKFHPTLPKDTALIGEANLPVNEKIYLSRFVQSFNVIATASFIVF